MKNLEERLRELPQIAESTGLQADERLKRKILREAQEKQTGRKITLRRLAPVLCALVVLVGVAAAIPALRGRNSADPALQDDNGGAPGLLSANAGGDGTEASPAPALPGDEDIEEQMGRRLVAAIIQSLPAGDLPLGDVLGRDLPQGSITILHSANPAFRSIWASSSNGNFPLIGVNGRYYRLLTYTNNYSASILGGALGTVDTYTDEPSLAGKNGICSNIVAAGETVYAVNGMNNAVVAAYVNGQLRVFQRVSYGDSALVGGEGLADTLRASSVTALELTGVGTITDPETAGRLVGILTANASFLRSSGGETNQSLLIQLSNGLVLQMSVNGERLLACGTWACPEFFDAFQEALQ